MPLRTPDSVIRTAAVVNSLSGSQTDQAPSVASVKTALENKESSGAVSTHAALTSGVHGISTFGASLVDDANAAAARTTLGLGTAATSDSSSFESSGAVSTHAALTSGVHGISTFGASLVDDANAAAARTTLGLVIGTSANNIVALDESAKLPAVDASQLTNLPSGTAGNAHSPIYGVGSDVYLAPPGLASTGASPSANTIYAVRVYVEKTRTFTTVGCNVTTGFGSGSTVRMAICNETSTYTPGTLVIDTGTVAANTTGLKTFTVSQSLSPGWYWLLWSTGGSGGQITAGSLTWHAQGTQIASTSNHGPIQYLTRSLTYAAYGDQTGATWTIVNNSPCPRLFMR